MLFLALCTKLVAAQSGLFHDFELYPQQKADPKNWMIGTWTLGGLFNCNYAPFEVQMAASNASFAAEIFDPLTGWRYMISSFIIANETIVAVPKFGGNENYGRNLIFDRLSDGRVALRTRFGAVMLNKCE
jgi:hypothetical protein